MANPALELIDPDEDPLRTDLTRYEHEAQALTPHDDHTERACLLFISKTREAEKSLEKERKAKTDPLNKEIERITAPYRTAITAFGRLRMMVEAKLNQYRVRQANEIAEQQRKAIADATAEKVKKEREAEEARHAAEAARANGNELAALKLETKAEKAELSASLVAPEVIAQPAKTVAFEDGSKVTMRTVKDWTYQNGSQRGKEYYRNDSRFQAIPDECFVLDEAKVGKLIRAGATIPGITVFEKASTITRKGAAQGF